MTTVMYANVTFYAADGTAIATQALASGSTLRSVIPDGAVLMDVSPIIPQPAPQPADQSSPEFLAHVLSWLREKKRLPAVSVLDVTAYGTDWSGDTYGGFHSESDITIKWAGEDGTECVQEFTGEDQASLWQWVVNGWPVGGPSA